MLVTIQYSLQILVLALVCGGIKHCLKVFHKKYNINILLLKQFHDGDKMFKYLQ